MNLLKKIPRPLWDKLPFLFPVLMIFPLLFINNLHSNAAEIGKTLGSTIGKTAGAALGSFQGITEGNATGLQDGKEEGLSAKDTITTIAEIRKIGKLEVLVATATVENFNKMGDDYAALYLLRSDVVFTVDLEKASFIPETSTLLIPQPEPTCYFDPMEIQKVAEYQKTFFSGSTEDGFTEYLNSMKEIENNSTNSIKNYDNLLESAKTAAINQVKLIAENMTINKLPLNVEFLESAQNER